MRKKQNYQKTDYAQNGELMCFGLSEHSLTENLPKWSERAKKDFRILRSFYNTKDEDVMMARPSYKSDWSQSNDLWRAQFRFTLGLLVLRELPVKSFVSR